jgi:addiction module RelE/StbE family toxin
MRVEYHRQFVKHFNKRVAPHPKLVAKFEERLRLKVSNPTNPVLKDHQLIGKKSEYRAFSVTGDVRVVYKIEGEVVRLYDIGTHNQVY